MIVRISTEGQYEVGDGDVAALNELDNAAVAACESGDGERFKNAYEKLLELVRSKGRPLTDDDELEGSDVILPPPDITLDEASADFTGEGLIPD